MNHGEQTSVIENLIYSPNQIAKQLNIMGNICEADIEEIRKIQE